jgi:hypothetical protein
VVVLVSESLEQLEESLEDAGDLDEDVDLGTRAEVDAALFEAASGLGKSCVDALAGLVISGAIDCVAPRLAAVSEDSPPLEDAWQRSASPYRSLAAVALAQRERLAGLAGQPQLYRHLHESISLAADVAAWTTWTQVGDNQP